MLKNRWLLCPADPRDLSRVGRLSGGRALASLFGALATNLISRPESRQDYPPNLSILISGGKENNYDGISNGE